MKSKNAFIAEAIKFGWDTIFKNFPLFLGLIGITLVFWVAGAIITSIITLVFGFALNSMAAGLSKATTTIITTGLSMLLNLAIDSFVYLGFFNICLKLVRKEKAEFGQFFQVINVWFKGFLTYLLIAIAIYLPFLVPMAIFFFSPFVQNLAVRSGLNIFAGVLGITASILFFIFALALSLAVFFVLDKKSGVIQAMKQSVQATNGAKWQLFIFGLAIVGINILGALCLFVGLFITIPLSLLAFAFVYQKLSSQMSNQPAV